MRKTKRKLLGLTASLSNVSICFSRGKQQPSIHIESPAVANFLKTKIRQWNDGQIRHPLRCGSLQIVSVGPTVLGVKMGESHFLVNKSRLREYQSEADFIVDQISAWLGGEDA